MCVGSQHSPSTKLGEVEGCYCCITVYLRSKSVNGFSASFYGFLVHT